MSALNPPLSLLMLAQAEPDARDVRKGAEKGSQKAKADGKDGQDAKDAKAAKESEKSADDKKAETGATEEEQAWYDGTAVGYLIEGGFFMWPILILGVLAAGVIIERYRSLKMLKTDSSKLRNDVLTLLHDDKPEDALETCERELGPVPAILGSGLRRFIVLRRLNYDPNRTEQQVVKTMEDYGVHVVAALERHLPILATVAAVAPMLGFLGTVQGMIEAFSEIEANIGEGNIVKMAAGGIKVALLTTCFGLIVGIPAFMSYNYFTSIINRFVLDVEESAAELIEAVTMKMTIEGGASDAESGQGAASAPSSTYASPDA